MAEGRKLTEAWLQKTNSFSNGCDTSLTFSLFSGNLKLMTNGEKVDVPMATRSLIKCLIVK